MATDAQSAFTNTNGVAFPNTEAVNASGPTATDGTEYVKNFVDNYAFGPQQALLNRAGITPNGTAESATNSQELEAMQRLFSHAGEAVDWYGSDPATLGVRILILEGQGVLVASYPDLVAATYVGDANNPTAEAFYRADDAAGATRNTAGNYFILPDARLNHARFKPEAVLTARIANSGTASITSQSEDFISSVSRTATGTVQITFNTNTFSVTPSIVASTTSASNYFAAVQTESASSVEIVTTNAAGTIADQDFDVYVARQGDDYNPFGNDFLRPGIRY